MKQEVSTPVIVAVVVVVLLAVGLIGWWAMGSSGSSTDPAIVNARIKAKQASGKF